MNFKLSVCIPTYNRSEFLDETIRCISKQLVPEVEIFVSDNASTDNTADHLKYWERELPNFRWCSFQNNVGYDRNFINLIEKARGEYCWILSSDDLVEPGAIAMILEALNSHCLLSGVSINGSGFTKNMEVKIQNSTFSNHKAINNDTFYEDGEKAFCELGEYFGFISAQVIKRELALAVIQDHSIKKYLNGYVHVYVIGKVLQKFHRWLYVAKPLVKWRSGNDSLSELGRIKRLAIDVNGFAAISGDIWGNNSIAYKAVQSRVCRFFVCASVLETKTNKQSSIKYMIAIIRLCLPVYWRYPVFWCRALPFILLPRKLLIGLKRINGMFKKVQ